MSVTQNLRRKSQLALEYAFRLRDKSPDTSVFWVYTSTGASFGIAYGKIAAAFNISHRDNKERNNFQLVKDYFENQYPFKWLMIIDNVDSAPAFFEEKLRGKPLIVYGPQGIDGAVLYTSIKRDMGVDLTLDQDPVMNRSMDPEETGHYLTDVSWAIAQQSSGENYSKNSTTSP